jgi:hypothetical protein
MMQEHVFFQIIISDSPLVRGKLGATVFSVLSLLKIFSLKVQNTSNLNLKRSKKAISRPHPNLGGMVVLLPQL